MIAIVMMMIMMTTITAKRRHKLMMMMTVRIMTFINISLIYNSQLQSLYLLSVYENLRILLLYFLIINIFFATTHYLLSSISLKIIYKKKISGKLANLCFKMYLKVKYFMKLF